MNVLERILDWAENNENVRMIIQTGSHIRNDHTSDELSDYDIELFVDNIDDFSKSDSWINEIKEAWIILPLVNNVGDPTRLVIYEGGEKVDFTLNKIQDFDKLIVDQGNSDLFNRGYKVLLDKNNLSSKLKDAPFKNLASNKPTQIEFNALVEEFFFEIYHVAKYLKREDLWPVKFRDWTTKELMLRMIEWYEKSEKGWDFDTWYFGQKMKKWIDPDVYSQISGIFAHFDKQDGLEAMNNTINLFREVAKKTAKNLNYTYPQVVDDNILSYVNSIS